jgi:hypothetical protein
MTNRVKSDTGDSRFEIGESLVIGELVNGDLLGESALNRQSNHKSSIANRKSPTIHQSQIANH